MTGTKDLFNSICSMDNLYRAYQNAKSGKGWYKEVKQIEKRPFYYLAGLQYMLKNHLFKTSDYEIFILNEGKKKRDVYKLPFFPERIAQWAILQVIEPFLLANMTADTYSAIPGKGIQPIVDDLRGHYKTKIIDGKKKSVWVPSILLTDEENTRYCFKTFWKIYRNDMKERLRENTMRSKDYIVELKILPYFGNRNISEVSAADIREWQNTLLKKGYSQTYLRTVNNQLSCIFNYAVKYYDLPRNPCRQAGTIGKSKADEMNFWTQDEFEQFISCMEDKPTSHCGFMILYWTGCRIGELLALTLEDFDEKEKTLRINKSYQRIGNRDVITDPKTKKGKRTITLPDFLVMELKEYTGRLYGLMTQDRLFQNTTKAYWEHEIQRGVELLGVKRIRLHDLRHSHASLLISKLGAQPNLVADRLGHEKIQTTLSTYSHLYPDQSRKLADQLERLAETVEN